MIKVKIKTNRGTISGKRGTVQQMWENGLKGVVVLLLVGVFSFGLIAINSYGESASNWEKKGDKWTEEGDFVNALECYSKAIRLDENSFPLYFKRGLLYSIRGDADEAIYDFTRAIELDPDEAATYFFRGGVYEGLGKLDLAGADYKKSCELGSEDGCNKYNELLEK